MSENMETNTTSFYMPMKNLSDIVLKPALPWEVTLAYNMYLVVIMVLGLPGNLLVLIVYFKLGTKNSSDWFIVFISIYDFISSVINVPVYLTFSTGLWSRFGNDVLCKIHMTFSQVTAFSSPFLIGGLALERYFKICRPSSKHLSKNQSRITCITIAVVTMVLSLPCVVLYDNDLNTCKTVNDDKIKLIKLIYYKTFAVIFLILFVILIFSYSSIAITVYKSKANLVRYVPPKTLKIQKRKQIRCYHILCCTQTSIFRHNENRQEQTSREMHVLQENKSVADEHTKPAVSIAKTEQQDKVLKVHERINKSLRTTRISFIICLVFLLSWIPPWISFAVNNFSSSETKQERNVFAFQLFARMSFLLNTFSNPIVYILLDQCFREKMRKTFACSRPE